LLLRVPLLLLLLQARKASEQEIGSASAMATGQQSLSCCCKAYHVTVAAAAAVATLAAAAAAAAGPEGIRAGDQVCISYGPWPAEPFLLLMGFTLQPNPADAVVIFDSLQDMAACYFDRLDFKLTAGSPAGQLLQSEQFYEAMKLQLAAVNRNSSSSVGFRAMTVDASGMDGRLKTALAVLHAGVAAAAASVLQQQHRSNSTTSSSSSSSGSGSSIDHSGLQHEDAATAAYLATQGHVVQPMCGSDADDTAAFIRQLQQIKLGELLVFRLEGLAHDLEQSSLNCKEAIAQQEAHGNSSSSDLDRIRLQQQQQQQQAEVSGHTCQQSAADRSAAGPAAAHLANAAAAAFSSSSRYQPRVEHLELIRGYCSSKAALARQLARGYPIQMSGVFLA
jgi:hypothetical protein